MFVNRMDAGETTFLERDLQTKLAESKDVKFRKLRILKEGILPINTELSNADRTFSYDVWDAYGFAKIVTSYRAGDIPSVDVSCTEVIGKIFPVMAKMTYDFQEIREAAKANKPLTTKRRDAVIKAIDTKLDRIAWFGDDDHNLVGLAQYPGITSATVPNDGTGSSTTWASKTVDLILRDIYNGIAAIKDPTNDIESPDTLLLPSKIFTALGTRLLNSANPTGDTILSMLRKTLADLGITTILGLNELNTAAPGGGTRAILYKNDKMNLEYFLPVTMEFFSPKEDGLAYDVPAQARTGGVKVYFTLSVAYMDLI
jgi:hypothetical protein